MRPPLGALPSVKLKLEKTLKVWAEAAVTSNVSASRLRASFTQNLLWVSKKQHRFYIHFSFFIAIDLFVMLRKSDGFPKLHGLFRRRQILEVGFDAMGNPYGTTHFGGNTNGTPGGRDSFCLPIRTTLRCGKREHSD